MKRHFMKMVVLLMLGGCGESSRTASDEAAVSARCLMGVLSTNSSVRAIKGTEGVRSNLRSIDDMRLRRKVINEWQRALYDISVDQLRPSDRYCVICESVNMVNWSVVGALWETGCSFEDAWSVYLSTLEWLDIQCKKMKPNSQSIVADAREELEKWRYYQALAEYRENIIENLEINGLDVGIYNVGVVRIDAVKRRFEKVIGRPVRPSKEIKHLGLHAKRVRDIITKEREAASRKWKICNGSAL